MPVARATQDFVEEALQSRDNEIDELKRIVESQELRINNQESRIQILEANSFVQEIVRCASSPSYR